MSLKAFLIPAAALVVALFAGDLGAWGPRGHQIVAEIGARHLNDTAAREVARLLGDRPSNAMREASTWADDARNQPEYKHTFNWHFVNFEKGNCTLDRKRQCPDDSCVFGAIESQTKRLGNRKLSDTERAEALRFVIHFVGDVHQPLHAGWRHDRGGNDTQVRVKREGSNLHGFWDNTLVFRPDTRVLAHADIVEEAPTKATTAWTNTAAVDWTLESCKIVAQPGFYPVKGNLAPNYVETYKPVADRRMHEAGLRLAALLNATIGR